MDRQLAREPEGYGTGDPNEVAKAALGRCMTVTQAKDEAYIAGRVGEHVSDTGVLVTLAPRDYDAVLFDLDGVLTADGGGPGDHPGPLREDHTVASDASVQPTPEEIPLDALHKEALAPDHRSEPSRRLGKMHAERKAGNVDGRVVLRLT